MNLYQYFKAFSLSKNKMENPVLISEDLERNLASISYNLISPNFTWEIPYMKDARGLILDMETGDVVARPYPKFFNYGEKYGKWPNENLKFTVEDKLDGSLVIVSTYKDDLVIASSGSLVSKHASIFTEYLNTHLSNDQLEYLKKLGKTYTLLFEYLSPEEKIVINYEKEDMILHGVIETHQPLGEFAKELPHSKVKEIGKKLGMNVIKEYNVTNFEKINDLLKTLKNIEGFVVKFENGYMLKFKTEEYVKMHHVSTNIDLTTDSKKLRSTLIIAALNNSVDDLIPFMSQETKSIANNIKSEANKFLDEAFKVKRSFIEYNIEHAENVNFTDVKENIFEFLQKLNQSNIKMNHDISEYFMFKDEKTLLEKGAGFIESQVMTEQNLIKKEYANLKGNFKKLGYENLSKLTGKQKQQLFEESKDDKPLFEKYTLKAAISDDKLGILEDYLNEVFLSNIELSKLEKKAALLKQITAISDSIAKLKNRLPEFETELNSSVNTFEKILDDLTKKGN